LRLDHVFFLLGILKKVDYSLVRELWSKELREVKQTVSLRPRDLGFVAHQTLTAKLSAVQYHILFTTPRKLTVCVTGRRLDA